MKKLKNVVTLLLVMILSMIILSGSVSAASTSIRTSASRVTVGKNVTITVSFGEGVSAAQFVLNYDTNIFSYVSCSKGDLEGNQYVFLDTRDKKEVSYVTFTFKAKTTGTGKFSISGLVLPNKSNTISGASTSVTVQKATTTTSKPNTAATPTPEENPTIISKSELDLLKIELEDLIETDYTPESWKALQESIAKAEAITSAEEYEAMKGELTKDRLVIAPFEKKELTKILIDLIGKVEEDYTEESWKALKDAIAEADNVKLASEYEKIKDKLTLSILEEAKKENPIINFFQGLDEQERISLALAVCVAILVLIIIIMIIRHKRQDRRDEYGARRLK